MTLYRSPLKLQVQFQPLAMVYSILLVKFVIDLWQVSHIDGVIVSLLDLNAVDCWIELRWASTTDYKIGTYWLSAKQVPLRSKNKVWLAQNQDNTGTEINRGP
jgi:hypothetical protein